MTALCAAVFTSCNNEVMTEEVLGEPIKVNLTAEIK
jgi:hypothetical protein